MRNLNIYASALALGLVGLTACESDEIYTVDSPDWLASRIDSIANNKVVPQEEELEGQMEDVYTFGKTDFSSGWWAAFSKYYVVPDGQKWQAQFNLHINPDDNTYYKNFALVIANTTRDGAGYAEYGAFRYDLTADASAFNSNWGTVFGVITAKNEYQYTSSTLLFAPEDNKDANLQKMNGKVTITIDRSDANRYYMELSNGTIVKTFDMPENIAAGEDVYAFLVPEGSYIEWMSTNIEPIGGCTSREDKLPISLTLKGVPGKVLQGSTIEEAFAGVTAEIKFEQEVSKEVAFSDLTLQVVPDMNELGTKTLIAAYAQTYKGEGAQPVIGTATFQLVDKMYYTLGESGCTTGWWGAHSTNIKVAPGETQVSSFTNYTSGVSNWNNWVMVLCREDNSEYAVVRADNYGWGDGYGACLPNCYSDNGEEWNWATWLAAMNGAQVMTYVTNNGDGTVDVKAEAVGNDGVVYTQEYMGVAVDDVDNVWYRFTVDGSCLVFDDVLGAEDNSTGWWGAHSKNIQVLPGMSVTRTFINYSSGNSNWNNWVMVICREDNSEHAVVRADNYGWGDGYGACSASCSSDSGEEWNWATWLAAMDGAKVSATLTNNADGTVDVKAEAIGNDGVTYLQTYYGIAVDDPDNVYFRFTVDGSHLVFDNN